MIGQIERGNNNKDSELKADIMEAIKETEDKAIKAVLLLMLQVLETIAARIDLVLEDEERLRELVLNGHNNVHDKHHAWLAERMAENCAEACAWAKEQKTQQAEDAKADKESRRKVRYNLIERALWALAVAAVAAVGWFD